MPDSLAIIAGLSIIDDAIFGFIFHFIRPAVLKQYFGPIITLTTVGGVFMMFYSYFMCKWIYKKDTIEHIVTIYGMWTGTITTGMALLKELDPNGKTNVPRKSGLGCTDQSKTTVPKHSHNSSSL